ncbi:MAG TPA: hypothetical protein PKH33_16275 [bacterium]|nr:hypothetical protein [bacterium]
MTKIIVGIIYLAALAAALYFAAGALGALAGRAGAARGRILRLSASLRKVSLLAVRFAVFVFKSADMKSASQSEKNSVFFKTGRFIVLAAGRGVLLAPVVLYSHFPSPLPGLSVLSKPLAIFIGIFYIAVFLICSIVDAFSSRKGAGAVVLFAIFYAICAHTLALWQPMFYVAWMMFKWFFPALAMVVIASVFWAAKTGRPILSIAAQVAVVPSCAAFAVAASIFSMADKCAAGPEPSFVQYYVNFCDESAQLIPAKKIKESLGGKRVWQIRERYRSAAESGGRVYIGASNEISFSYDFDSREIVPIGCGFFSFHEDAATDRLFFACPQDRAMLVFDGESMTQKKEYRYGRFGGPYWLEADEESRSLFAGFGETTHNRAIVYSLDGLEAKKLEPMREGYGGSIVETAISPDGIVYFIYMFNGIYIGAYDIRSERLLRTRDMSAYPVSILFHPESESLFIASPYTSLNGGEIIELDPATFEDRARMKTPVGARDIAAGSDGFLYVSNYLTGDIYRIDWAKRRIAGSVNVGRKIKRMEYDRERNYLTFASERGYARVDIAIWQNAGGSGRR